MTKYLLIVGVLLCNALTISAQDITGNWKTVDDETGESKSVVNIFKKDGAYYGKIIQLFRKPSEDQNPTCTECKGSKLGEKIIGMEIIEGLTKQGNEFGKGTILDPNNGKIYDCKIWLDGSDKLMVRGYVGLFFRTQEWIRVD